MSKCYTTKLITFIAKQFNIEHWYDAYDLIPRTFKILMLSRIFKFLMLDVTPFDFFMWIYKMWLIVEYEMWILKYVVGIISTFLI